MVKPPARERPAGAASDLFTSAATSSRVLRRWPRGGSADPLREVDAALRRDIALFTPRTPESADGTTVVAFCAGQPLGSLLQHLIETASRWPGPGSGPAMT